MIEVKAWSEGSKSSPEELSSEAVALRRSLYPTLTVLAVQCLRKIAASTDLSRCSSGLLSCSTSTTSPYRLFIPSLSHRSTGQAN